MASDSVIRGMFASLEACIHERLTMIEEVCRGYRNDRDDSPARYDELMSRFVVLESAVQDLKSRSSVSETVHVNCIGKEETPGLFIKAMKDLEIILPPAAPVVPATSGADELEEVEAEEEEEEIEEVEAEEEEAEEEMVEDAEQEGEEVEEITFKGKTYYKDSENNVYMMDDSGELSDSIGKWDLGRQRVLFARV